MVTASHTHSSIGGYLEGIAGEIFGGKFDKCIIVFNKFKSAISQEVTQQQLIPLHVSNSSKEENVEYNSVNSIYDYEPDEETI